MPPKSSKSPTASKPPIELNLAAVEDDISGLTLNDGEVHDIDEKSAPIGPGAKARRRRNREKSWRLERSKDAEADDAASKTPKERDSISEAGNAEPNDVSDTDTIATEPLPQFRLDHPPRSIQAPLVGVPILAHYELRELPDTGDNEDDHDEGLFATQKIYQGTRIISERPILTLPAPGDQLQELVPAYYNLPKVEQERIWNLRPAAPEASEQLQNLRFLTDRLAFDLQNIIFKSDGARTKVEEATLEEMAPKLENAMNVWRVAARWHANRCSMTDLPAEQREYLPKGTPITGLFIERAHIRHSCLPNCFASYDANLGRMNVHVTRDIAAGEELTLSAFADTTYYKNAADRKEELSAWGLTCNCEACDEKHPKFQTHEAARQRAHTRAILLADTLTRLDVDEQFSEDDLNTAQDITLALIRDLKASACENVETVRWRNILVDRILPVRSLVGSDNERLLAMHLTVRHAKEAERLGRICYGEDREEFKILKQTKEGCEATVKMAEEEIATALARTEMSDEE